MNNKPTCHPENPESGQQANRQAKLDTSSSQPEVYHWENPRICCTCQYFYRDHSDPIQPGCPACAMREHTRGEYHRACTLYTPKHTD